MSETRQESFDLAGMKVMLGMPIMDGRKAWETERSLIKTREALERTGLKLVERYVVGCSVIEMARSRVCHELLESDGTHLFMVDADMVWKPEDFIRLLALATRLEVVGATYVCRSDPPTFMLRWEDDELVPNQYGCVPIRGMGLGFTVVQYKVIKQLAEKSPKLRFQAGESAKPHLFRSGVDGDSIQTEDMAFFEDVRGLGYKVWMDPEITLGHVGTKVYSASIKDAMLATN